MKHLELDALDLALLGIFELAESFAELFVELLIPLGVSLFLIGAVVGLLVAVGVQRVALLACASAGCAAGSPSPPLHTE